MAERKKPAAMTADDKARYRWLLDQVRSEPIADDGSRIFDVKLALPPAKTVEESIDLARRPFIGGQAMTACFFPVARRRSKVATVPCDPVTLDGYERFRFGVHLEPGHSFRWHVTELSSGASVTGHCPSRQAALVKLRERVGKSRPEYFQQKLDMWRDYAYKRSTRAAEGR